ncbi:MFS transporter [Candidatus Marsarchaeota G2 archaeon ECH_B_SAG-G16]|uniref:MFS transporter n=1 Tax=Candidatus Marsarchaeota G2 archaeon ECH_B_SAG-G16 TaxID=1978167 RepID=A0A2R6C3X0_9ARCH|nr:MAG: MFS transporter [Candidatus Marsarchaeota G2 archaeon ECH_B_SAG-G16]
MEVIQRVDFARWGKAHWAIFASTAIGYFMWGVIGSLAYLAYPQVKAVWFLVLPILSQLAGDLGFSWISDKALGRKSTFYLTMFTYGLGSLILAISALYFSASRYFVYLATLGIVLGLLGVEGEVPVALSYIAEIMPLKFRDKMLVLSPNFDNLGAMVAALLGYITFGYTHSTIVEIRALALFSLTLVLVALVLRYVVPESIRWLDVKGLKERVLNEAKKIPQGSPIEVRSVQKRVSLWKRFAYLVAISVSQYLTYGLMAFVVADYYFSGNAVNFIIFLANLAATLAGVFAAFVLTKLSTRSLSLLSYVGGALSMVPIYLLVSVSTGSLFYPLFYSLLSLNMAFSEFAWAVRTILEPTLMPTSKRAFLIGLIRVAPMVSYSVSVYYTSTLSLTSTVFFNALLWGVGAISALVWSLKGYDVNLVPLEQTSH